MAVNIGPKIGIDGEAQFRKEIKEIIQQQKTLKSEMDKVSSSWDKNTSAEKKASDQKKALNEQIKVQEQEVQKLSEMVQKSAEKYGETDSKTLKWKESLNKANTELNNMKSELANLPDSVDLLGQKMEAAGDKISAAGDKITGAGKAFAPVSAAAAGGLTYAVKTASDFEAQMDKVQAISGANAETMAVLEAEARDWGKRTKFSAVEAGEAFEYMAMAGWKDQQMVAGIGPILNLATAAGEELGTTSDIVTDALTAFNLTAEDTGHFTDVMAAASSNANTNVALLGESFKYVAPVAGALNYDIEDVAVALGLMANSGIKGSMAGTSLRNVFQRLAKPTKESESAMTRLGISLQDEGGNMYSFMEIMEQLRDSMGNIKMPTEDFLDAAASLDDQLEAGTITQKQYREQMDELLAETFNAEEAEKARAAAMLGGSRAMAGLLAIVNASPEDFAKLSSAVTNSSDTFAMLADGSIVSLDEALMSGQEVIGTYNGTAEAMAAVMKDNLNGQVTELKSAIDELAISIGQTLTPVLQEIVGHIQSVVDKFNELDPETKEMIATIGVVVAAVSPVLIVIGSVVGAVGKIIAVVGKLLPAIKGAMAVIAGINPVVALVVAAIAALVAIGIVLYKNWDTIKEKAKEFAERVSKNWNELCEYLKGRVQTTIDGLVKAKDTLLQAWENLKQKFADIKNDLVQKWEDMKTKVTTTVGNIKSTVQQKFETIRDKIKETIEKARDTVKDAIEKIKGFFNFTWELPKIKLPHFSIEGEFSLNPPSIPHIGVEWYSKAMEGGAILRNPTIFGAANGRLLGAGEAGPEVVVGASSLFGMIQRAVGSTTNNYGGNNVYVYGAPGQDVKELAHEIANIINADVQAEGAVW